MKVFTLLSKTIIAISIMALLHQGCRPIGGGCPYGPFSPVAYNSFILGYRDQVDTLQIFFNYLKTSRYTFEFEQIPNYIDPEPILTTWSKLIANNIVSEKDSLALTIRFTYKRKTSYLDSEQKPISRPRLEQLSRLNGDTNFKRMVSGFTVLKSDASGRIVLEDTLHYIKVFANQDYAHFRAGDDISECFTLAYTDPYHIAQTYQTFSKDQAGKDYLFLDYVANKCFMGRDEPKFDQQRQLYRLSKKGAYQWYDGEYFPIIQYHNLAEFNFRKVPHLSTVVALIPKVYPTKPGEYSFTVEAKLYYGQVLRSTTGLLKFSGI